MVNNEALFKELLKPPALFVAIIFSLTNTSAESAGRSEVTSQA
jgi:hypothetical protein